MPVGGDVAHRDIAALGHELAHQLAPHARAAAGDDRDPAREILHGLLPCGSLGFDASACGGGRKGQAQLIRLISTPRSRLAQTRSAVTTATPEPITKAKQARSPSDSPACRVIERNRAAMRACGPSNGTTRKSIVDIASSLERGQTIIMQFRQDLANIHRADGRADKLTRIEIAYRLTLQQLRLSRRHRQRYRPHSRAASARRSAINSATRSREPEL